MSNTDSRPTIAPTRMRVRQRLFDVSGGPLKGEGSRGVVGAGVGGGGGGGGANDRV